MRNVLVLLLTIVISCLLLLPVNAFTAQLVCESNIEGDFEGFVQDNIYELDNGSYWIQTDYKYKYHYAYRPKAAVVMDGNAFYLFVENMEESVSVDPVKVVMKSSIENDFDGWDGDTIIKLSNGSVWEQADYQLEIIVTVMPKVVIFKIGNKYFAKVDQTKKLVRVERLK